jgi:signal transduction histidine kinase
MSAAPRGAPPAPLTAFTPTGPLTVLLVEDNPGDAELLRDLLAEPAAPLATPEMVAAEAAPRVVHVERVAAAREVLRTTAVDVVLLDLSLPDARGLDTVARVREAAPQLPIVVLTGLNDEALAVRAVQAGAQDYLVKGAVNGPGVRRALRHAIERQRLYEAATRATRARDEVLGVVAHDLRNPLATVKMCAGALAASPEPAQVAELTDVIRRSTEWMEHIIRDLLDVTAIEAGRLSVARAPLPLEDLLDAARAVYAPLAAERGLAFEARCAEPLDPLDADADRLLQAVGNLVGNAVKFTPAGGRVTLTASRAADGRATRLEVADTGPGIAAAHLPNVFDRFWQARETRRAGAGLGLAIARGIAEAHGGTIGVDSAPGAGARFFIDIPDA